MKTVAQDETKTVLYCSDNRFDILYITAELENDRLAIRYSRFKRKSPVVDIIYRFDIKSTKNFAGLISETQFLANLKQKFNSKDALKEIAKFADEKNLKYEIYNHFDYNEYNFLRYNFGDIYDDNDKLFYEDGSIIIPALFKHPKDGICKIYTEEGSLYLEISYENNQKNGLTRCFQENSNTLKFEQYYKNNRLDGVAITYYSDGSIKTKELFENGELKETLERNIDNAEAWYFA